MGRHQMQGSLGLHGRPFKGPLGDSYCYGRNAGSAHTEALTLLAPHGSCHELAQTECTDSVSPFS